MKFTGRRKPDWPRLLNEYIAKALKRQFRYGRHDCCTFACGAVRAMTGVDPMKPFRGAYKNEKEAASALRTIGSGTLYSTFRSVFGNPVPGASGKRGDVAYHEKSCGVVVGRNAIFFGENGYILIPISKLEKAFRVPFDG